MPGASKILAVLGCPGTGKATTIGNLAYKCGGIDMPTLERLEKGRNDGYAKAFNDIKARNEELHFYTPRNKIIITVTQESLSDADGLLLIVTPHQTGEQLQGIRGQLDEMMTHSSHRMMVVLINKLDEVNWSEDAFTESVRATSEVLHSLGVSEERFLCVPASGLHSDNLIELSLSLGWYSKTTADSEQGKGKALTVVDALDHIFS